MAVRSVKFSASSALPLLLAITLLMAAVSKPALAAPGSAVNGRRVYIIHCFQCHGEKGEGNGPAAAYLPRWPRDFTDGLYKLKTSPPTTMLARDDDLYEAISNGIVTTGMPAWKEFLSEGDIWDLVAYLKSLSDMFDDEADPPPLDVSGKIPFSLESANRGNRAYFKLKCHECHGIEGQGPAIKELKDEYGYRIWPRDLTRPQTYIGPRTPEALYARITNGIPLTPMPAHVQPGDRDSLEALRWDIVNYLIRLADEAEKKRRERYTTAGTVVAVALIVVFVAARRRRKLA